MSEEKAEAGIVMQNTAAVELILGGRGSLYPAGEADFWREAFTSEPYYQDGRQFQDYGPAYELGWTGYCSYGGEFDTADRVLANDWIVHKGVSGLSWEDVRPACRAAWQRAHIALAYRTDGSATPQVVVDTLEELVDNARDGELGFIEAAAHTETAELREFFQHRAQCCRTDAAQLQERLVPLSGGTEAAGTVTAAAQRVWLQIRGLFGGAGDAALLTQCLRGDDGALNVFRAALQRNLPQDLHDLVRSQLERTQREHDKAQALLERIRSEGAVRQVA